MQYMILSVEVSCILNSEMLFVEIPDKFNLGILIIDHDMSLIMKLCNRLHVLDSGKTIAEGLVDQVKRHPDVVKAYLGEGFKDENA